MWICLILSYINNKYDDIKLYTTNCKYNINYIIKS